MQADGATGEPEHTLSAGKCPKNGGPAAHPAPVLQCRFRPAAQESGEAECSTSATEHLVATCSGEPSTTGRGFVSVWCCASGEVQHVFDAGTKQVLDIAWSPCGRYLAAAAGDKALRVWDVANGGVLASRPLSGAALSLAWSRVGRLCVGMANGAACIVDLDLVH